MMWLTPIEIIALILSLTGTLLVIKHKWIGYFIWFQANLFWMVASYGTNLNGGIILFLSYQALNIYGIYDWYLKDHMKYKGYLR